jgi:predicted transcriptional regulator
LRSIPGTEAKRGLKPEAIKKSRPMKEPGLDDLVAKVKAISESPQRDLFIKIVDNFFEHLDKEYFSSEDLADIEEGLNDIRQGRCLTLEEYRHGKRL